MVLPLCKLPGHLFLPQYAVFVKVFVDLLQDFGSSICIFPMSVRDWHPQLSNPFKILQFKSKQQKIWWEVWVDIAGSEAEQI